MFVTNPKWRGALVPLFLAAQILVVRAVAGSEHPPAPPALARFPAAFGDWKVFRSDPIESAIARELGADQLVSQTSRKPNRLGCQLAGGLVSDAT
jgi:hypothetical protein